MGKDSAARIELGRSFHQMGTVNEKVCERDFKFFWDFEPSGSWMQLPKDKEKKKRIIFSYISYIHTDVIRTHSKKKVVERT